MAKSFVFIGDKNSGMALAQNLLSAGYPNATSIESADIIFTLCPNQTMLEDIYFDSAGIISNARPGSFVIDMSPASPAFAKEVSAMSMVNDLHPIEAPIVLRDPLQEEAYADPQNIIMFAAGEEKDFDQISQVLDVLSDTVIYRGEAGEAQIAKCAITMQLGAQIASFMEAEAMFRACASKHEGVALSEMAVSEELLPPYIQTLCHAISQGDFSDVQSCNIEMMLGEFEAVLMAADDANVVVPNAESVKYLVELLANIGGAPLPISALKLVYSDQEEGAKFGLDWRRAESHDHDHCECGHDDCDCHHHPHDDDDDEYGYEDPFAEYESYGYGFEDGYDDWSSN